MRWRSRALGAGLVLASLLVVDRHGGTAAPPDPDAEWRDAAAAFTASLAQPDSARAAGWRALLAERVDLARLTESICGDAVRRSLEAYEKALPRRDVQRLADRHLLRLSRAVAQRLLADLAEAVAAGQVRGVEIGPVRLHGQRGTADLLLHTPDGPLAGQMELVEGAGTGWKLTDLALGGRRLRDRYREAIAPAAAKSLSPPALEALLLRRPYVILDDFADTDPGQLPLDWGTWRDKDRGKPVPYRVAAEGREHYLAARDSGFSVILGKFCHWDAREYPIMTWCWRAHALPAGGDESRDDSNDSAAGVYVIFSQNWLGVPKQLKYVWSTTVPEGTVGRRNLVFRPWFFVLESGERNLGRWVFEQVDLAAHHESKLGGRLPDRTIGLGLLTDANSTGTRAAADYADLRVWTRAAQQQGQIEDYCACRNQGLEPPRHDPHRQESTRR